MDLIKVDYDKLRSSIARQSFWQFLKFFWSSAVPEDPSWNWHMEILCNELQTLAERVFRKEPKKYDLVINVPPGTSKSTICSIMFPAWIWTRMPTARCICSSYSADLSVDLGWRSQKVFESELYRKLFPHVAPSKGQEAKSYFATKDGGSRYATSTGGSVTGMHGHFLIVDDPLNPNQAASEIELATANRFMSQTLPSRVIDKKVCPTILIMQRLHEYDPTAVLLEKAKTGNKPVRHICLPGELTDNVQPAQLRRFYVDGLLDAKRLDKDVLATLKTDLGDYSYAGQVGQSPIPSGGGMFKIERLTVDTPTMQCPIISRVRYWDKAGSTKKTAAFTVGTLVAKDMKGRFWIEDVKRGRWSADAREAMIFQTAKMDGKSILIGLEQEPGSGGMESAQATVRMLAGYRVKVDKVSGDKVLRAEPFAVQVNNGNVFLRYGSWNAEYVNELQYFPYSRFADQVDSSSGAFNILAQTKKVAGGFAGLSKERKRA